MRKVWCVFYWVEDQPVLNSIHVTEESAEKTCPPDYFIEAWHVHAAELIDGSND